MKHRKKKALKRINPNPISNGNTFITYKGLIGFMFTVLLAGGGWWMTDTNKKLDTLINSQYNRAETTGSVNAKLEQLQKDVQRLDRKMDQLSDAMKR